jgi:hypothetical protein
MQLVLLGITTVDGTEQDFKLEKVLTKLVTVGEALQSGLHWSTRGDRLTASALHDDPALLR